MSSGVGPHRTVECGPGSPASRILILNVSQSSRECREVDKRKDEVWMHKPAKGRDDASHCS